MEPLISVIYWLVIDLICIGIHFWENVVWTLSHLRDAICRQSISYQGINSQYLFSAKPGSHQLRDWI